MGTGLLAGALSPDERENLRGFEAAVRAVVEPNVIRKLYRVQDFLASIDLVDPRILNVGSSSVRLSVNSVNVDIVDKPDVDIVADAQSLPDLGQFDVVVADAMLQYVPDPMRAVDSFERLLRPGGYLFVDAPWMQPYCPDRPDLKRFSRAELLRLFERFDIVECGPSITSGSAIAYAACRVAGRLTGNRYVDFVFRVATTHLTWPLRYINAGAEESAGAFYLVARKRS